jgi:hypothetical protein
MKGKFEPGSHLRNRNGNSLTPDHRVVIQTDQCAGRVRNHVRGNSVRGGSGWRWRLAVVAFALLLLAPAAAGAGVPSPAGPVTVATYEGSIGEPAVAIAGSGEATLAWVAGGHLRVATRRSPTGRWHISGRSFPGAVRPQLAIDSAGDAILAWQHWEGSALAIETAFRPAGHAWGPATQISGDIREGQGRWHLAMNGRGDAVIVWSQYRHQEFPPLDAYYVLAATMSGAGGTWSAPSELTTPAGGTVPDLALNAHGEAIVAWRAYDQATRTLSVEATFGSLGPAGTAWSAPAPVSEAGEDVAEAGPRVAIGDDGAALVTWGDIGRLCSRGLPTTLLAATVPPGGSWSAPTAISRWGDCPTEVQPAIDATGRATVLWESAGLRATQIRAASGRPTEDEWTPPVHLATASTRPAPIRKCIDLCLGAPAGLARLVPSRGGSTLATWRQEGVGIVGSLLTEGRWTKPTTLLAAAGSAELDLRGFVVASRSQGEVLLAWVLGRDIQVDALRIPSPTTRG